MVPTDVNWRKIDTVWNYTTTGILYAIKYFNLPVFFSPKKEQYSCMNCAFNWHSMKGDLEKLQKESAALAIWIFLKNLLWSSYIIHSMTHYPEATTA